MLQNSSSTSIDDKLEKLINYAGKNRLSIPGGTLVRWRELIETGEDIRKIRLFIYRCGRKAFGSLKPEILDAMLSEIGSGPMESDEITIDPERYPDVSGTYTRLAS